MNNVPEIFASYVFNEGEMRDRLPKEVFKKLRKTIDFGDPLDPTIANDVAHAMKEWAVSKGATHYTLPQRSMTRSSLRRTTARLSWISAARN